MANEITAPNGLLSLGIKLGYKAHGGSETTYTNLPGLQEIPDLGGEPERVDVTTLADASRRYINGIKDYDSFAFTFLYDAGRNGVYTICKGLEDGYLADPTAYQDWQLEFPDGAKFNWSGACTCNIIGQSVNTAIQFTLNIALNSDMTFTAGA